MRTSRAICALVALIATACAPPEEGSRLARVSENLTATQFLHPYDLPVVTLTDQDGEPFHLRGEAAGKVTLLYFGYTHCPDVCPITMARVGRGLSLLEPHELEGVLPVFITLDAERDPPEQVRRWVQAMHPAIVGLTGSQDALDDAVRQLGFVFPDMERPAEGFYEVAHPATLFIYTPELLGRYGYPHGEATPEEIAADIRTLLAFDWTGGPGGGADAMEPAVTIRNAFALDPLGQSRMAVYGTLTNTAPAADTLVGIRAPGAGGGSVHRMAADDGIMRMYAVDGVPIESGASVELAPGALHGMLEGVASPPSAGDTLDVTFVFARAGAVTVRVPVRHPADAAHPHPSMPR